MLYSEMVVDNKILHAQPQVVEAALLFSEEERPIALQLGGYDPNTMGKALEKVLQLGYRYDEINLNSGCPAPSATKGDEGLTFGAGLMRDPKRAAAIVKALKENSGGIPITVKCRLGVDDLCSYPLLEQYVATLTEAGADFVIVHARKAILTKGFSAKQNMTVPPLVHDWVYQLLPRFPQLKIVLNGGIETAYSARSILRDHPALAGVMIGRGATEYPWQFGDVDRSIFGVPNPGLSRREVLLRYAEYVREEYHGPRPVLSSALLKPLHHIFHLTPGSREFNGTLSLDPNLQKAPDVLIHEAMAKMQGQHLDFRHLKPLEPVPPFVPHSFANNSAPPATAAVETVQKAATESARAS
jgi:tRNA-dihydrouridine synthase A